MYTLAVPKGVHADRTRSCLKNELQLQDRGIDYNETSDDDGFVTITFINADEDEFRSIVLKLKAQGISMIGVDTQLTERKIMKLTDLIKEDSYSIKSKPNPEMDAYPNPSPANEEGLIEVLKNLLKRWQNNYYEDDKSRWENYFLDIEELVQDWEENRMLDKPDVSNIQEQKLRKLIRKTIRQ